MAYSTQRAVSDGSLNLLDISLDYFDRADISVYFDNIVQTTGWSWVGATEKKISFTPNVPAGIEVLVVRTSDLESIRHEYSGGAQFTSETLDENMRQLLHIAQEARENANIEDVYRDLNMHGYKLKNVGPGVDPNDAMTIAQGSVFVDQTEAAVLLAEQWASGVGVVADGKYSAKHYAEEAEAAAASVDTDALLTKAGNLAGLISQSAARANLGLGSAATANTGDFQAAMVAATQAEMVAGTEPALRALSPLRVRQAVQAHAARAWCRFDGTLAGTNAPLSGFNVTSVTRTAVGRYTINFTNAAGTNTFAVFGTSTLATSVSFAGGTTGSASVAVTDTTGTYTDSGAVCVQVLGG